MPVLSVGALLPPYAAPCPIAATGALLPSLLPLYPINLMLPPCLSMLHCLKLPPVQHWEGIGVPPACGGPCASLCPQVPDMCNVPLCLAPQ